MIVKIKRGWERTYKNLTAGNVYRVVQRSGKFCRLLDDCGEPVLFLMDALVVVDPTTPANCVRREDGFIPQELDGFPAVFERWSEGDPQARSLLQSYLRSVANSRTPDAAPAYEKRELGGGEEQCVIYSELDSDRRVVRRVDKSVSGYAFFLQDSWEGEPLDTSSFSKASAIAITADEFEHAFRAALEDPSHSSS